jgi:hypothetical protein
MLVQVLDNGNGNKFFYQDGERVKDIPDDFITLRADKSFEGKNFTACFLLGDESTLLKSLDKNTFERYRESVDKKRFFLNSFKNSNFNLKDNDFWTFVPFWFKEDYLQTERDVIQSLSKFPVPKNYDFLKKSHFLLDKISKKNLNIERDFISKEKFKNSNNYVRYNLFGTITGRLTTHKNSFPIMSFDKTERKILKPQNDFFVELDYNGAEIRTLFNLIGKQIEEDDVYDFFLKASGEIKERGEIKKQAISWLYNPNSFNTNFDKLINKEQIVNNFYKDGKIITPFQREIFCDKEHALNYLLQSTTSDVCLEQSCKIDDFLTSNKLKTFIAFMLHDCLVLDVASKDFKYLKNIKQIFEKNDKIGLFKSNAKMGKNYGEMKKISL